MAKIISAENGKIITFEGVPVFQEERDDDLTFKEFLKFLLGISFHPMFVLINALKLRCPLFRKKSCLVKIIKKELKELKIGMLVGSSSGGISIQTFLFHFEINGRPVLIEVDPDVYERSAEGEEIFIEYIDGADRVHTRLAAERA